MNTTDPGAGMNKRYILVIVLFLLTSLYIHMHKDMTVPTNKAFTSFPVQVGEWRMSGESFMSEDVMAVLKASDYLSRSYQSSKGERVTLYLGYHGGGEGGGEIHSPKHCLPGSGWFESYTNKLSLGTPSGPITMVKSVYQKGDNREMFLYWFQVKDATLDNEYSLKLAQIVNSAVYRRRDATFVRISVPFTTDEAKAQVTGEQFIRDFYPVISSYLPK